MSNGYALGIVNFLLVDKTILYTVLRDRRIPAHVARLLGLGQSLSKSLDFLVLITILITVINQQTRMIVLCLLHHSHVCNKIQSRRTLLSPSRSELGANIVSTSCVSSSLLLSVKSRKWSN